MYKINREMISMPRADSGYLHKFGVNSWGFKDDESETEVKTNSGHRVCPLLFGSSLYACTEHGQRPLLACGVSVRTHTHPHTFTADTFNSFFF